MTNESKPNPDVTETDKPAKMKATFLARSGWPNTVKGNFKFFLNLIVNFFC